MQTQEQIKNYAQIVHLYWHEGTLSEDEVKGRLGDLDCELNELTESKIVFTYFDDWYPTKMTVYKSGRVRVDTDLDELP